MPRPLPDVAVRLRDVAHRRDPRRRVRARRSGRRGAPADRGRRRGGPPPELPWGALILLSAATINLSAGRIVEAADLAREALALTRRLGARASEAQALCLVGDVASTGAAEDADACYRQAVTLAAELGMRPLVAHCHLGLGKLARRTGDRPQAQQHLATATTMYREMDMRFWLDQVQNA